jgi:hypothetical protein
MGYKVVHQYKFILLILILARFRLIILDSESYGRTANAFILPTLSMTQALVTRSDCRLWYKKSMDARWSAADPLHPHYSHEELIVTPSICVSQAHSLFLLWQQPWP